MKTTHKLEDVDFEWDSDKAEKNQQKHDVSFPEASEAFFDPFAYPIEAREKKI
jgi:uncharacterized DUF497 family protein